MIYITYVSVYAARIVKQREKERVGNTARDDEEKESIYNPRKIDIYEKMNWKISRVFGNNCVKVWVVWNWLMITSNEDFAASGVRPPNVAAS